jgi:hypothetical protein
MVSVVDAAAGKKVGDIQVEGDTLEAMTLETSSPKLYVNNAAKNEVDVIDRNARTTGRRANPRLPSSLNNSRLRSLCCSPALCHCIARQDAEQDGRHDDHSAEYKDDCVIGVSPIEGLAHRQWT